ncbi:MAG: hypothetical protein MZV70_43345 [Desulfobacterales bacterium]|nr:hypothetical protein [Desulfobacterales bacterium]
MVDAHHGHAELRRAPGDLQRRRRRRQSGRGRRLLRKRRRGLVRNTNSGNTWTINYIDGASRRIRLSGRRPQQRRPSRWPR